LLEFTRRLIHLRKEHPLFRRRRWFQGQPIHRSGVSDIDWFTPDGQEMAEDQWGEGFAKSFGVFLNGEGLTSRNARGERIRDVSFYLLFNAHYEPLTFTVPAQQWGKRWVKVLDTNESLPEESDTVYEAGATIELEARSLVVLRHAT
jgi:glycogen operon protein